MSQIIAQEEGSAPSTPGTGRWKLYPKAGGWYVLDDAGNEIGPLFGDAPSDGTQYARKDAAWEAVAASGGGDGWTEGTGTWSYSSADDPTFIISINADVTAEIGVGDKIKYTQTTVKYGIVHAVGAYSGGATLITIYGGTDYDLVNAAITSPYYSHTKTPFGFPSGEDKWTVSLAVTTRRSKTSPTQDTWYGGTNDFTSGADITISVPIGLWRATIKCSGYASISGITVNAYTTFSSNAAAETNPEYTMFGAFNAGSAALAIYSSTCVSNLLSIASKTLFYMLCKTGASGVGELGFYNDGIGMSIRLVDAYL